MDDLAFHAFRWMQKRTQWIPIEELVDGALYVIHARHAHLGIWHAERSSFIIAREKSGQL